MDTWRRKRRKTKEKFLTRWSQNQKHCNWKGYTLHNLLTKRFLGSVDANDEKQERKISKKLTNQIINK
jgi:hypothetical protein